MVISIVHKINRNAIFFAEMCLKTNYQAYFAYRNFVYFWSTCNHSGNEDEFRRLLMNGANINATDENGNSALLLAAQKGNDQSECRAWFKKNQKCEFWKYRTNSTGTENMVTLLAENGADVNVINKDNNSALILSIESRIHWEMIFFLLSMGKKFWKLLFFSLVGFEMAARLLIRKGANVNAVGNNGNTPLIVAAMKEGRRTLFLEKLKNWDVDL